MSSAIFELKDVAVRYGALAALQDVSLRIEAGERIALIGPSGAGKSTLLGVLNGSIAPSSGDVRLLGQDTARLSARALRRLQRQIGTVYQQFNLVPNLSVIHNVNAGHLGRWSLPKRRSRWWRRSNVRRPRVRWRWSALPTNCMPAPIPSPVASSNG